MRITSEYMNDPFGVELVEPFETEIKVVKPDEGGLNDTMFYPFISVDFFSLVDGVRPDYPQNNRTFHLPDIEGLSDAEILEKFYILVPELKK